MKTPTPLKVARQTAGKTQADVVRALHDRGITVTERTYVRWENESDPNRLPWVVIEAIAAFLCCLPVDLVRMPEAEASRGPAA